jgi:hypothetical protein
MTFEDFDAFTEDIISKVKHMRDTKGKEYARSENRFDNFNRLANDLNLNRNKVWQVYFTKHLDSIKSYIDNNREFSNESIQDRIVDAITYLILLAGMIEEDNKNGTV